MDRDGLSLTAAEVHKLRGRLHVVLGCSELLVEETEPTEARSLGGRVCEAAREVLHLLDTAQARSRP